MCDMNVKERLKEAFESVAFSADNTWIDSDNTYQKTNLELYSAEKRLQQIKVYKLRPRTVEDCIPSSRLAKYTNPTYYDESREMCYVPCSSKPSHVPFSFLPNEPWEMFEVDELFYWYMAKILPLTVPVYDDAKVKFKEMIESKLNRNFPTPEECYESPFLNAAGFEDKILKTQLTEDRIKSIWNHSTKLKKRTNNNKIFINIYFSPIKNYYVVKNDVQFDYNWYWKVSSARDLAQIEKLSKALKKQSTRAENWLRESNENAISSSSCTYGLNEPSGSSTEVLYSEVLQGLASTRKSSSSSSKHEQSRIIVPDDASSSSKTELSEDNNSNNFTNFTVLNHSQKGENNNNSNNKYQQQQKQNSPIRIFQNKMKMYPTPVASSSTISVDSSCKDKVVSFSPKQTHYFQSEAYSSGFKASKPSSSDQGKFLVDAGPGGSYGSKGGVMVPSPAATAHANYFQQQAYFYPPTPVQPHQGQQRWIPSSFCYPPQMYNSPAGWVGQNQVIMSLNYDFNRFVGQSTVPLSAAAPALKNDLSECSTSHVFNITTLNKQANGSTFSGNLTATSCSNSIHLKTYPTASVQQQIPTPEIDGYPFTANTSEELEIQALEQYNSSNENFYKELERQASEQYAPE